LPQCHDRLGARVAWVALRTTLRRAYESLLVAVSSHRNWNEDAVGTAFGAIAHAAYHLGAMRQRLPPGWRGIHNPDDRFVFNQSGRRDLNPRPPEPHATR